MILRPGIERFARIDDGLTMLPADFADDFEIDPLMTRRIRLEVRQREGEQPRGGAKTLLLQMNEAPGHLNESLIKFRLRLPANRQPDFLQHVVRLVVELRVEAVKKAGVMAVESRQLRKAREQRGCGRRSL